MPRTTLRGVPLITAELNDNAPGGERVNHKRVARVMRLEGIRGYVKKRRVRTTIPEPSGQKYPDLLKRTFTAEAPNQCYVGDITYLPLTDGTNLYLATVIECYSRRLAGWAVADHMRTELVENALKATAATRGSHQGAIFHSDHGSVYCSKNYAKLCARLGVTQSMGAVGSSADNASAESFNATMKREVLRDTACWSDEQTCRPQLFRWLVRYNTRRRHTWCGYLSPSTCEARRAITLLTASYHTPCPGSGGRAPPRSTRLNPSRSPCRDPGLRAVPDRHLAGGRGRACRGHGRPDGHLGLRQRLRHLLRPRRHAAYLPRLPGQARLVDELLPGTQEPAVAAEQPPGQLGVPGRRLPPLWRQADHLQGHPRRRL